MTRKLPKHATELYGLVPKGPVSNLLFRQVLCRRVMTEPEFASLLRAACREDFFFWLNCVAEGTRVVTDRGPVPIEQVTKDDLVWDGQEWVAQEGALCKGIKSVIFKYRTWITPEHKVRTIHGWQPAEEGYDRAEVRLPDGYPVRWPIQGQGEPGMALSMPMRQRIGGMGPQSSLPQHDELWLSEGGGSKTESHDAWWFKDSSLHSLVCNAGQMRKLEEQDVSSVRRARDNSVREVEPVRKFHGRYGGMSRGPDDRADRQRQGLQSGKLPLGISAGAGEQYLQEQEVSNVEGVIVDCAASSGERNIDHWDEVPDRKGSERRCIIGPKEGWQLFGPQYDVSDIKGHAYGGADSKGGWPCDSHDQVSNCEGSQGRCAAWSKETRKKTVYDLVNCGPRKAFTILDADGEPLVVHNCMVWTIDQKRPHPRKKVPFISYGYQDKGFNTILSSMDESFDVSIEKSRQMGASWMFVVVVIWCWLYRSGQNFLLLSRSDEYVDRSNEPKSLFWKIDYVLNNLPSWMMPPGWNKKQHRLVKRIINPRNGNTIVGEATTEDSGRGGTFTAVLHDEFGACDVGMGILKSTRSATGTRWFNSTPKGTGNAHYRVVQLSRQNPKQVRPLRFHWSDHPEYSVLRYKLDDELVPKPVKGTKKAELDAYLEENAELVASLKKRGFWEEYKERSPWFDTQCARATTKAEIAQEVEIDYGGAGYQFFEARDIQDLMQLYCCLPKYVGDLEFDPETLDPVGFREHGHGSLELWCEIIRHQPPARPYVIGVDAAAGTGASNSVLSIWDAKGAELVGQYVDPNIKPERLAKLTIALCRWFWDAYLIWETNGSGRAFGDAVVEWGYGRYYKRPTKSETGETGANAGWAPTRDNKYQLLSQYRGALADRTVCNRSEQGMRETLEYMFLGNNWVEHSSLNENEDPSGARDQHGDRVIASALAVKVMDDQPKQVTEVQSDHSPLSVAGRREMRKEMEKEGGSPFKFN